MLAPDGPRRPRALVVDDDDATRTLVCELLKRLRFEAVDGATAGAEGLFMFEHGSYGLVVTALAMPGMTGWDVTQSVRGRAPATGVIVTTGSDSRSDRERARKLGVTLLSKPFLFGELLAAIDQALDPDTATARARVKESTVTQDVPVLLGTLRAAVDAGRQAAAELETFLAAREREHQALREAHEALTRDHHATVAALAQLQTQHDALRHEREAAVTALASLGGQHQALQREHDAAGEELDALVRRFRRGP